MAISTISQPDLYTPAYNPMEYIFSSTNVAECDFQFVADLYINGVFATRLKAVPEESTGYGIFRVERIVQDHLSFDFNPTLSGFAENDNSLCNFHMRVMERYNSSSTCTGSTTLSAVLTTTSTRRAYAGGVPFLDWPSFVYLNYMTGDLDRKFLTNSPKRIKIPATDNFNLSFLNQPSDPATEVVVLSYDRFNTLIETGVVTIPYNPTTDNQHEVFGCGPAQLATQVFDSGKGYHSNVHWYQVYLRNSGGDRVTEIKEFEIDNRCGDVAYRFWWLNPLSGFDSIAASLKRTRNVSIQKTTFEKRLAKGHTLLNRGETVLNVDARDNWQFNTNWLTYEEGLWIEELFTSPEVFLHVPAETTTQIIDISGAVYNAGTVDFILATTLYDPIDTGTTFSYRVDDFSAMGAADSGTGTITGFSGGAYQTDVPATINSGSSPIGQMIIDIPVRSAYRIPVVVSATSFEEKESKIRYAIDARPSFKKTIQRQ